MKLKNLLREENIYLIFNISLIGKSIIAFSEIIGGVATYFVTQNLLIRFITNITQNELAEDNRDVIANYLLYAVQNFSISSQHFAALYLLSHGIIKMILIIWLLRERLSYYPVAIVVFSGFIVYQFYRLSLAFSPWLLIITLLDVLVIWMTWHEYGYMKKTTVAQK
jgi:uncharacterized membrane protein